MRTIAVLYFLVLAVVTAALVFVVMDHRAATVALEKAANDYRDQFRNYEAERLRIGQALSQLEKDIIRIRRSKAGPK